MLVVVAVAATTFALGFANSPPPNPTTPVVLPGDDPQLAGDIAAISAAFGGGEVITHQPVALPGTLTRLDLRGQNSAGRHPTLRLVDGRYPAAADEVALTRRSAGLLGLRIGDNWTTDGRSRRVVGLVENPQKLDDQFALVTPADAGPPATVSVLVQGTPDQHGPIRVPSGRPLGIEGGPSAACRSSKLSRAGRPDLDRPIPSRRPASCWPRSVPCF